MTALSRISGQGCATLPWLSAVMAMLAAGLWAALGPAAPELVFDRSAIAAGEIWRLVTGHLVHGDARHAMWDIGALAIIGCAMEERGRRRILAAAAAGIVVVDAWLWWFLPELERYCGLSGMLNALFVVALADLWQACRHPAVPLVALLLLAKLAAEISSGVSLVVTTAWPSLPEAHLAGCLGGLCLVLEDLVPRRRGMRLRLSRVAGFEL